MATAVFAETLSPAFDATYTPKPKFYISLLIFLYYETTFVSKPEIVSSVWPV
jgi:hypothetical protein